MITCSLLGVVCLQLNGIKCTCRISTAGPIWGVVIIKEHQKGKISRGAVRSDRPYLTGDNSHSEHAFNKPLMRQTINFALHQNDTPVLYKINTTANCCTRYAKIIPVNPLWSPSV